MNTRTIVVGLCCAWVLVSGCSRQQSDWQKTRETNTTESYEQYLKKYPSGEFTAQAQARAKELYEERDWQKARDADTPEAYQAFLKQYPDGKWTEEARIRVENFTLAQAPSGNGTLAAGGDSGAGKGVPDAPGAAAPGPAAESPPVAPPLVAAKQVTAAKPAKLAKVTVKAAAGSYAVQLGAFKSGAAAAHERWTNLQKAYPALLGGLSPKVSARSGTSGTLYRLQATGLTEKHARDICSALKLQAQACVVVAPAPG